MMSLLETNKHRPSTTKGKHLFPTDNIALLVIYFFHIGLYKCIEWSTVTKGSGGIKANALPLLVARCQTQRESYDRSTCSISYEHFRDSRWHPTPSTLNYRCIVWNIYHDYIVSKRKRPVLNNFSVLRWGLFDHYEWIVWSVKIYNIYLK